MDVLKRHPILLPAQSAFAMDARWENRISLGEEAAVAMTWYGFALRHSG